MGKKKSVKKKCCGKYQKSNKHCQSCPLNVKTACRDKVKKEKGKKKDKKRKKSKKEKKK